MTKLAGCPTLAALPAVISPHLEHRTPRGYNVAARDHPHAFCRGPGTRLLASRQQAGASKVHRVQEEESSAWDTAQEHNLGDSDLVKRNRGLDEYAPGPGQGAGNSASHELLSTQPPGQRTLAAKATSPPAVRKGIAGLSWAQVALAALLLVIAGAALGSTIRQAALAWGELAERGARDQKWLNLFDMEMELGVLRRCLNTSRGNFYVVTGPADSGKTALFKRLMAERELEAKRAGKEALLPIMYLDCRRVHVTSPQLLADALRPQFQLGGYFATRARFLTKLALIFNPKMTIELGPGASNLKDPLLAFLSTMEEALRQEPNTSQKLTLIIDEASILYHWQDDGGTSLSQLLAFFTRVASQEGLMNFILVSSESLDFWLAENGVKQGSYRLVSFGDLPEEDAKRFLFEWLSPQPPIRQDEWLRLFQVTGGNIGGLRKAAELLEVMDVDKTVNDFERAGAFLLHMGLGPEALIYPNKPPPQWTHQQFDTVIKEFQESNTKFLPRMYLEEKLEPSGVAAIRSLVLYNILEMRPSRGSYRDLKSSDPADIQDMYIVMPTSEALYSAMLADGKGVHDH